MGVIETARGTPLETAGAPSAGTDEVQSIDITGTPTGGTFKLSFMDEVTADIAYDADAAAVEAAVEALNCIGSGGCTIAGTNPNFGATFGANLAKLGGLPLFVLEENALTGGTTPSVSITQDTPGVTADGRGAGKGARVVDVTNGVLYINTGTALEPTWTKVGTQT